MKKNVNKKNVIANAFRDRLHRWPKIGAKDGLALRKFADFLRQCVTAMDVVCSPSNSNDERQNKILEKFHD